MKIDFTSPLAVPVLASTQSTAPAGNGPATEAVDRFDARMRDGDVTGSVVADVDPGITWKPDVAASGVESLGGQILRGLAGAGTQIQEQWKSIAAAAGASVAYGNMQDVIRFQATMIETTIQYELLGKVAAKGEQIVDQLVKIQ